MMFGSAFFRAMYFAAQFFREGGVTPPVVTGRRFAQVIYYGEE